MRLRPSPNQGIGGDSGIRQSHNSGISIMRLIPVDEIASAVNAILPASFTDEMRKSVQIASQKFWVAVTLGALLYINRTPIALANHQPSQNHGSGNIYLILFGMLAVGAASVAAYSAWNKRRKHRLRQAQRSSRRKR